MKNRFFAFLDKDWVSLILIFILAAVFSVPIYYLSSRNPIVGDVPAFLFIVGLQLPMSVISFLLSFWEKRLELSAKKEHLQTLLATFPLLFLSLL